MQYLRIDGERLFREEWRKEEDYYYQACRVTCVACGWTGNFKSILEGQMWHYLHLCSSL